MYGWLLMVVSFLILLMLQLASTESGIANGQFSVLVETNVYGENYLELALEILAIPAVLWTFRQFVAESPDSRNEDGS